MNKGYLNYRLKHPYLYGYSQFESQKKVYSRYEVQQFPKAQRKTQYNRYFSMR